MVGPGPTIGPFLGTPLGSGKLTYQGPQKFTRAWARMGPGVATPLSSTLPAGTDLITGKELSITTKPAF